MFCNSTHFKGYLRRTKFHFERYLMGNKQEIYAVALSWHEKCFQVIMRDYPGMALGEQIFSSR